MTQKTERISTATTSNPVDVLYKFPPAQGTAALYLKITGDADCTVQYSPDGIEWRDHGFLVNVTTDGTDGNFAFKVKKIRLVVNSITTGYAQLTINTA